MIRKYQPPALGLLVMVCRLEHLERVSASAAAAVLVLHPEATASTCATATAAADTPAADVCGGSSAQGSGVGGATGGTGSSSGGMSVRPGADDGAAALKLQTVMALTAQLMGRKAAVVVQVGTGVLLGMEFAVQTFLSAVCST